MHMIHLEHDIRQRIATGEFRPGERLDSVRTLASTHRVAHATAAKVLRDLAPDE